MQDCLVRQLIDSDRWRLRPHFKQLYPEDRRLRFGATLDDAAVDRYVDLIDFDADAVLGIADEGRNLIACAHVAPVGEGAELGLSVLEAARGRGHGGALFEQAVVWARNRYLQRIFMHCLRENRAILHLAHSHGMTISMDGTERSALLLLPAPDIATWSSEQAMHWRVAAGEMLRVKSGWDDWLWAGPRAAAETFSRALQIEGGKSR